MIIAIFSWSEKGTNGIGSKHLWRLTSAEELHWCCGKVDVPGVLGRVDSLGPSGPLLISEDDKHVHFRWQSTK